MDQEMRRQIILDNYQNPLNKGLVEDSNYIKINTNNVSCIDNLDLMVKIENGIIKDIRFDGEACVISTSTTSIMISLLMGKTIDEAKQIIHEYQAMIDEKSYDENMLKEATAYSETYKQPNRKKCALLTWNGMEELLNNLSD